MWEAIKRHTLRPRRCNRCNAEVAPLDQNSDEGCGPEVPNAPPMLFCLPCGNTRAAQLALHLPTIHRTKPSSHLKAHRHGTRHVAKLHRGRKDSYLPKQYLCRQVGARLLPELPMELYVSDCPGCLGVNVYGPRARHRLAKLLGTYV